MSNTSGEIVVIIRPSFKKICGKDACRAALYNHLLFRLARKAKNEPDVKVRKGDVFWFASAEDICQDMDEAWCTNKIRKEIGELVKLGLVGQRHNPTKGWDRKYQYFIGKEHGVKLQELAKAQGVCLLHIGLNAEVLHLLHMVNAFAKNGACICQKEEMDSPDMVNASTKNGGAIPKGFNKGSSQGDTQKGEEKEPDPPVSVTTGPKEVPLTTRIEEIHQVLDDFRGFPATWTDDDEKGARQMAKAGKTDQQVRDTLQTIKDDPDRFDWEHLTMKIVAKRVDSVQQTHMEQEQSPPPGLREEYIGGYKVFTLDNLPPGIAATGAYTNRQGNGRSNEKEHDRETTTAKP